MRLCAIWIGLTLAFAGVGSAIAVDGKPAATSESRTLESYGGANKTCPEWTDGCAVCRRQQNDAYGCSLPGIACQPTAITCRDKAGGLAPSSGAPQADPSPPAPYTAPAPDAVPDTPAH